LNCAKSTCFKQTLKYDEWLVVDDCLPRTKLNLGQTAIYPEKIWQQGDMTLTTNLITALKQATRRLCAYN
jgi:hypothetical protein